MSELDKVSKTAVAVSQIWSPNNEKESGLRMSDSPHCCFICNNRGISARNSVQIFGNQSVLLESGRGLCETLSEVLGCTVGPTQKLHSDIICKKCYKNCEEYDVINSRAKEIKLSLMDEFKKTLTKYNIDYNNYGLLVKANKDSKSEPGNPNTIMSPLPKLSPMPKNVVILHNGKKLAIQKSAKQPEIPKIDLDIFKNKIPILMKDSLLGKKSSHQTPESINEHRPNIQNTDIRSAEKQNSDIQSTERQSFDVRRTEKESTDVRATEKQSLEIQSMEKHVSQNGNTNRIVENTNTQTDGQIKVIDDDISVLEIDTDKSNKVNDNEPETKDDNSEADKFIISEVEIMDGDFELQDGAIVMEQDENGDFLRVLNNSGRFLKDEHGNMHYTDSNEISVLMPEQSEPPSEDRTQLEFAGQQFKIECNDSNDGQIELQMSGDEDTANAILAAARQQGTTFIKLESGGVFRLRGVSVESEQEPDTLADIQTKTKSNQGEDDKEIVHRSGSLYTCLLCLDKAVDNITQPETNLKSPTTFNNTETSHDDTKDEIEPSGSKAVTKYERRVIGNAKSISLHVKNVHGIKIYICELCGDVMKKLSQYMKHKDQHDPQSLNSKKLNTVLGARSHVCTVCYRKFSSKNILEEHMNMHNGIRPYRCSVCDKSFASKYTHQAHMKTHTIRPRPYACDQCGKSFLTLQNLSQHEKTHSGIKEYVCKVCGKAFGTQHNLEVHGVVHSGQKPFVCRTCGKSFARHAEIRDHERTHTGERPFPCDICGASFSQRSNLQSHRRACHFDDKRHSCPQCDRRFKRRRLLEYHIKASHTGERPHKCDICGASFVYPEHYKKHRRIHSGEKPYSCEVCGKPFNSRDNRNAHRFVHSDKKPYECMMCGMGFMRKPLLYTHMNTAGHLTDTIVVNQPQLSLESGDTQALVGISGITPESSLGEGGVIENIDDQLKSKDDEMSESDVPSETKYVISGNTTYILQNGEDAINLIEESETPNNGILGLPAAIESKELEQQDGANLEIDGETEQHIQIVTDENGHVLTTDENGTMIRLVQIQLPGGEHGWVALGP